MNQSKINFNLSEFKKEGTPIERFNALAGKIKEKSSNCKHIYTDSSKMDEKVAAAAVTDPEIFVSRLSDHSSIFTAEARAIDLALEHIKKINNKNYIVFSVFVQTSPTNSVIVKGAGEIQSAEIQRKGYHFFLDSKPYWHKRQ